MGHIKEKLRELVNRKDINDQELWTVISALRGPDGGDDNFKQATTCVIRHKLGFRNEPENDWIPFVVNSDTLENTFIRKCLHRDRFKDKYSHFYNHVRSAFVVLNLDWDNTNL